MRLTSTHARRAKGFTLIETLVATVVTALGVLGILSLQMRTLADTQSGVRPRSGHPADRRLQRAHPRQPQFSRTDGQLRIRLGSHP